MVITFCYAKSMWSFFFGHKGFASFSILDQKILFLKCLSKDCRWCKLFQKHEKEDQELVHYHIPQTLPQIYLLLGSVGWKKCFYWIMFLFQVWWSTKIGGGGKLFSVNHPLSFCLKSAFQTQILCNSLLGLLVLQFFLLF